jgi:hypothetical protein
MFRLGREKFKIFDCVIEWVAVPVMNHLGCQETSADIQLHNAPVLQDAPAVNTYKSVAIPVNSAPLELPGTSSASCPDSAFPGATNIFLAAILRGKQFTARFAKTWCSAAHTWSSHRAIVAFSAIIAFSIPACGSFGIATQWDARTTGNDANGAGFDAGVSAPGTDYSTQDAPQVVYTDLLIGATATQVTSAANPFSALYPGNAINVTGGTGCTTGRYEVLSVSGVTATLDQAPGTTASVCTANLGGGVQTIAKLLTLIDNGFSRQVGWIKAGTYSQSAFLFFRNVDQTYAGYTAVHGDLAWNSPLASNPLITTATDSTNLCELVESAVMTTFRNVNFSNTAGTPAVGINNTSGGTNFTRLSLVRSKLSGFTKAIADDSAHQLTLQMVNSEVTATTVTPMTIYGPVTMFGNYIHDNPAGSGTFAVGPNPLTVVDCVFARNTAWPVTTSSFVALLNSDFTFATGDGFKMGLAAQVFTASGNIFYGNSGYGINAFDDGDVLAVPPFTVGQNALNAYGANTSGARNNVPAGGGDIALSANPFANSAGGNFALNGTAGGGAPLKGTAFPGIFPGGLSTGHLDIGAVQSPSAGAFAFAAP